MNYKKIEKLIQQLRCKYNKHQWYIYEKNENGYILKCLGCGESLEVSYSDNIKLFDHSVNFCECGKNLYVSGSEIVDSYKNRDGLYTYTCKKCGNIRYIDFCIAPCAYEVTKEQADWTTRYGYISKEERDEMVSKYLEDEKMELLKR